MLALGWKDDEEIKYFEVNMEDLDKESSAKVDKDAPIIESDEDDSFDEENEINVNSGATTVKETTFEASESSSSAEKEVDSSFQSFSGFENVPDNKEFNSEVLDRLIDRLNNHPEATNTMMNAKFPNIPDKVIRKINQRFFKFKKGENWSLDRVYGRRTLRLRHLEEHAYHIFQKPSEIVPKFLREMIKKNPS